MTDFVTDIYKENEETCYNLVFNTKDKEVFEAMQSLARRMIDRKDISTNYEYICTRTPEELSYIIASIAQACDEQAAEKVRRQGFDITLVSLAPEIQAQSQLHWLNQPYHHQQEK